MKRRERDHGTARPGRLLLLAVSAALFALFAPVASAQERPIAPAPPGEAKPDPALRPGWTFSPSLGFGHSYEDNVILAGRLAPTLNDQVSVLNPALDLRFNGRYSIFELGYTGSLQVYRSLGELNGFDQRANTSFRRRLSPRVSLAVRNHFSRTRTTDLVELNDVPFARVGTRFENLNAGFEFALGRYTSAEVVYRFDWVDFDESGIFSPFLRGGRSHGVGAAFTRQVGPRANAGVEYEVQHTEIGGGAEAFEIHRGIARFDVQLTQTLSATAGGGIAALTGRTRAGTSRTGPAWQFGLAYRTPGVEMGVSYSGSIVPSYGIGGTVQNRDLSASARLPLGSERVHWLGTASWRQNDPLSENPLSLNSYWLHSSVGVELRQWLRLEGYYEGSFQDSQLAGGRVDRHRVGIQLVTGTTMRIR